MESVVWNPLDPPAQHLCLLCKSQEAEEDVDAGSTSKTDLIKDLIPFHYVFFSVRDFMGIALERPVEPVWGMDSHRQ